MKAILKSTGEEVFVLAREYDYVEVLFPFEHTSKKGWNGHICNVRKDKLVFKSGNFEKLTDLVALRKTYENLANENKGRNSA